ncbi:NADP-dependent oxidoreductase [Actinorhabdospora filicis]|uniref:NADP-dependent oxidoreductase n=1 Tax=Actinorhabdospora filicis TaxID=1785913 RepID=A0A9W6WCN7_9ACTN|nr:NADP-dependent oxidoreductase [Actinorhabdospora filicis]GLZ81278.1 NADP-dependent oxidoreductase [Actinorhabdospora filicis]
MTTAITVHQVRRPAPGLPSPDDFALVSGPLPETTEGTALVENLYLSVDPYHREVMEEDPLHQPLEGRALGRVVSSRLDGLHPGDLVFHRHGWRTHALVSEGEYSLLPGWEGVPLRTRLSLLGGTGLSAYVGLTRIAKIQPGETVFVSAAAGGVGTAVGVLARLMGAGRVIGSTGSPEKARRLVEDFGFDAAFDYHDGVTERLREAAPEGIDVFFDNVGGDHLAAAIDVLKPHGRVAWCGAIAQYNDPANPPAAPYNLYDIVGKSIRLEGFLVRDYRHVQEELEEFLVPHLRSGAAVPAETVVEGIENIVEAFIGVLSGKNIGKMIVGTGRE